MTVAHWILEKLRARAHAAQRRVESGERLGIDDSGNFSLTDHIKNIERLLQGDSKRVQTAIDEIRGELKVLRRAVLPEGGVDTVDDTVGTNDASKALPPVKVPPHMT